jgi:hypothetical protein
MAKLTQVVGANPAESRSSSVGRGDAVLGLVASRHVEVEYENKEGLGSFTPPSPVKASGPKHPVTAQRNTHTSPSNSSIRSSPRRPEDYVNNSQGVEEQMSLLSIASSSLRPNSPAARRAPERTNHRVVFSKSQNQDNFKSRKGEEIDDVFSDSIQQLPITPTHSPATKKRLARGKYVGLPSSPSLEAVRHSSVSKETKRKPEWQPTEVEEGSSSVSSSPSTGLTYMSDRSDDAENNSPIQSRRGSPRPATIVEDVPTISSPATGVTQIVPNQESVSSHHFHHPHSQLPSFVPSTPVQHCQCEILCPHCHRPRGSSATLAPFQVCFYPDDYPSLQFPIRGVLFPSGQPAHFMNVVHDTSHDPRSPISRGTAVPQPLGR